MSEVCVHISTKNVQQPLCKQNMYTKAAEDHRSNNTTRSSLEFPIEGPGTLYFITKVNERIDRSSCQGKNL